MTKVVTYESKNVSNPKERWTAYAVLPSGELWLVRCCGETEEIAKSKALALYESEREKWEAREGAAKPKNEPAVKSEGLGRGAHFLGKVWMINKTTGDKKRVSKDEVAQYEWAGYIRGGPRS